MPELQANYVLTTPGPDLTFNAPTGDTYWITAIEGLDGEEDRRVVEPAPQTDGGILGPSLLEPRRTTWRGWLMVRSAATEAGYVAARNALEDNMKAALEAIRNADGTITWTRTGVGAQSLTVRRQIKPDFEGGWLKTFIFGLISADPTIS